MKYSKILEELKKYIDDEIEACESQGRLGLGDADWVEAFVEIRERINALEELNE